LKFLKRRKKKKPEDAKWLRNLTHRYRIYSDRRKKVKRIRGKEKLKKCSVNLMKLKNSLRNRMLRKMMRI